ncbi:dnaJ [Symbiodinium pilosum]|uniref:DnaJ protein n=1 Tax=Symbiodinium pilosum TaxID=2952 RepID=A0A812XFR9_SYMPI|nr:dnaJ [Symbiodinium pilosum]
MRCKIPLDGPWHDGWTWHHIVATAIASFLALWCWPSSQFISGQRATHTRATMVARRAVSQNPFDVLGLSRGATYDEIRSAFRSLARTYHPDVPGTGDEDRFRSIREALEELGTPQGRARWSSATSHRTSSNGFSYSSTYASSYSSYSSGYSSGYGGGYGNDHGSDYDSRRQSQSWEQEVRSRRARKEEQRTRQQQKRERDAQKQDVFFERELQKAVAAAKYRQARRRKEWQMGVKETLKTLRRQQEEDLRSCWDTVAAMKQRRHDEAKAWKDRLDAERAVTATQREKDGKIWVEKFATVQEESSSRREELGRRHTKRLRDFREELQEKAEDPEALTASKLQEEIDNILCEQDERNTLCFATSYKSMMKSLRRSIGSEPKIWKDSFRSTLIQLGKGGQAANKKWVRKFQDTMREMGEAEQDEVADWVQDFKKLQRPSAQEPRFKKLAKAARELSTSSRKTSKGVLDVIERCRKAEVKRLKWQAWNRKQWIRKFRQAEDKAYQMEQEEQLRLTEEFWQAVKESQIPAAGS